MNVRIRHTLTFAAGIHYGGETQMNSYCLTLHMTTNSTDATSHNVAYERIKYFVYNCIDSTIFLNRDNEKQARLFMNAGMSITTLPGEPVDQLIGLMLHYKLNAIMEERMVLEETEISSTLGENIVYLHGNYENTDIPQVSDWWTTPDTLHSDFVSLETDKIVSMHASNVWRELELMWPESAEKSETGNIVVFADFKPNDDTK